MTVGLALLIALQIHSLNGSAPSLPVDTETRLFHTIKAGTGCSAAATSLIMVYLRKTSTFEFAKEFMLLPDSMFTSISVSPDKTKLAASTPIPLDANTQVFDLEGRRLFNLAGFRFLAWDPEGNIVTTNKRFTRNEYVVDFWNPTTRKYLRSLLEENDRVVSLAFDKAGKKLAYATIKSGDRGLVRIGTYRNGGILAYRPTIHCEGMPDKLVWSNHGDKLLVHTIKKNVSNGFSIYHESGARISAHHSSFVEASWSPTDNNLLLIQDEDRRKMTLLDTVKNEEEEIPYHCWNDPRHIAWAPSGEEAVAWSWRHPILIIDAVNKKPHAYIKHEISDGVYYTENMLLFLKRKECQVCENGYTFDCYAQIFKRTSSYEIAESFTH